MSIELYLLLLVGLTITLLSLLWWLQYKYFFETISNVPIPWFVPIFGNAVHIRKPDDVFWSFHNLLITLGKGATLRISLGFLFGLIIADPLLIEAVINHSAAQNKSNLYKFLQNSLGDGLLLSKGDKWRSRRKLLTPAYHYKILKQFVGVLDKNGNILVQKMRLMEGNNRVDIDPHITLCALDIICGKPANNVQTRVIGSIIAETSMGISVNAQLQSKSNFVQALKEMKTVITRRISNVIEHNDFIYQFTINHQTEKNMVKVLHDHTTHVITVRRSELIKQQTMGENEIESESVIGIKKKEPFLDLLLHTSLSDEDIREEVRTFTAAGLDTVAAAISFTIYILSKHLSIQQRVYEEQKNIYGNNRDREAVYYDFQRMKYLEMVIKEALRLYPPGPVIARDVSEDFQVGDMVIKKGLQLLIAPYSVHRNPSIYPQPEVFNPERFTPEACAKRHAYAYLPFSAGFRNCPGQKFAMLEMKSAISKLVRNFEFTDAPNSDLQLRYELVLNSMTGVHVGIKKRVW